MFGKRSQRANEGDYTTLEFRQLVSQGRDQRDDRNRLAFERWGIGGADRWSANLAEGTLNFHFSDHVMTGPAEVLGTFSSETDTWLWGWANESLPEKVTVASHAAAEVGQRSGLRAFVERKLPVESASAGDDLAAVAAMFADLAGVYRAPTRTGYIWFGFRDFARTQ